jgi:hypothetical protein
MELALGFLLLLLVVVVAATLQDAPPVTPALDAGLAPERPALLPMAFKPSSAASRPPLPTSTVVLVTAPDGSGRSRLVSDPARVAAVVAQARTAAAAVKAVGTSIAVYVVTHNADGTESARTLAAKMTLVKQRETTTGPLVYRWRIDKAPEVGPS